MWAGIGAGGGVSSLQPPLPVTGGWWLGWREADIFKTIFGGRISRLSARLHAEEGGLRGREILRMTPRLE